MTGPAEPLTLNVDDSCAVLGLWQRPAEAMRSGFVGVGTASVAVLQVKRRGLPTPSPDILTRRCRRSSLSGCGHDRRRPSARGPAWEGGGVGIPPISPATMQQSGCARVGTGEIVCNTSLPA